MAKGELNMDLGAMRGRHFLTLGDYTLEEIQTLIQAGLTLKKQRKEGVAHPLLAGKTLGMIFEKNSTRTRVAFEVGMYQLGGHALCLNSGDLQLSRGEPPADTVRVLSRMVDGVMIRTFGHETVEEMARYSGVPVINGLTDRFHPTQILADLMTITEYRHNLAGLRLVFVGDGNNVAHSLMIGGAKVGMHVTIACPEDYAPDAGVLEHARQIGADTGADISVEHDARRAATDADILYTDVWASMGEEGYAAEKEKSFARFQLNAELLRHARPDALVMHCLPAKRGKEITADVLEGPQSVVFDEAENRLHAHKAILACLLSGT
jgi:ornithine carbamoyltransferase